jgi:carbonic anhydrase
MGPLPFLAFVTARRECRHGRCAGPIEKTVFCIEKTNGSRLPSGAVAFAAAAIRENVKLQAQTLVEASTVISSLVSAGKVLVAGGIFDLQTGRVEPVHLA